MPDRTSTRNARQALARAHDAVFDTLERLDLRNASDREMERLLDAVAVVARGGASIDDAAALDELAAVARAIARRKRPWKSRRRWRADVRTVTHEPGHPTGRTEPPERLREALRAAPLPTPGSVDNVVDIFSPRRREPVSPRAWRSQRGRAEESLTRGLQDETF